MLTRTQRLTAVVTAAVALLAGVAPADAGHGDAPAGKEWSQTGTFETRTVVLEHDHINNYRCDIAWCAASGSVENAGPRNTAATTVCTLTLFTTKTGCGHNGGDWTFTGHNELLTGPWSFCNGQATIYDASHCGEWVDAPPDCPAADTPRVQHRHASAGSGAHTDCQTHVPSQPACPTPAPAAGAAWTWNPGEGGHTARSMAWAGCGDPPPACPATDTPTSAHRHTTGGHADCETHRPQAPACPVPAPAGGTLTWNWTPPGGGHSSLVRQKACAPAPCRAGGLPWWPVDVLGAASDAAPGLRDPYHDTAPGANWGPKVGKLHRETVRKELSQGEYYYTNEWVWKSLLGFPLDSQRPLGSSPEGSVHSPASGFRLTVQRRSSELKNNYVQSDYRGPAGWLTSASARDGRRYCGNVKSRHKGLRWETDGVEPAEGYASSGSCPGESCDVAISLADNSPRGTITFYRDWEMKVTMGTRTGWRAPSGGGPAGICESTTARSCTFTVTKSITLRIGRPPPASTIP